MPPASFQPASRLTHNREFDDVFSAKLRRTRGPLTFYSLPNSKPHYRLGLSIGKAAGNAVARNRFKRIIREAFRLQQHSLPLVRGNGLDLIVSVRAHDPKHLTDYADALVSAAIDLAHEWDKRAGNKSP